MAPSPTVYLVSGANRGIGLALVKALSTRPDVFVFAGVRKPDAASDLLALARKHHGKVHILSLISTDEANNRAAVEEIRKVAGRLDVVIANAAICGWHGNATEVSLDVMREHFEVNTLGTLALFQATYPLLKESTVTPKFIPISSVTGSIGLGASLPVRHINYSTSKAAINFLARKIRDENNGLICFPLCPGIVDTTMMQATERAPGTKVPAEWRWKTPDETALHLLARIDEGTRETDAFVQFDGQHLPW